MVYIYIFVGYVYIKYNKVTLCVVTGVILFSFVLFVNLAKWVTFPPSLALWFWSGSLQDNALVSFELQVSIDCSRLLEQTLCSYTKKTHHHDYKTRWIRFSHERNISMNSTLTYNLHFCTYFKLVRFVAHTPDRNWSVVFFDLAAHELVLSIQKASNRVSVSYVFLFQVHGVGFFWLIAHSMVFIP